MFSFSFSNVSDIILVAIGFYVGDEKGNGGRLPFALLGAIAAGTMLLSEVKHFIFWGSLFSTVQVKSYFYF